MVTEKMQSAGDPDSPRLEKPAEFFMWALGAAAVFIALPYGWAAIYPVELLATLLHEAGHLAGVELTGGKVTGVKVALDGTGKTHSIGGATWVSVLAGHAAAVAAGFAVLGSTLVEWYDRALIVDGAVVLAGGVLWMTSAGGAFPFLAIGLGATLVALGRHYRMTGRDGSKAAFTGTVAILIAAIYLALSDDFATWMAIVASSLVFVVLGYLATRRVAEAASLFVAAHLVLSPLIELPSMLTRGSGYPGLGHSDASAMAHWLGGPTTLWAVAFAIVAVGLGALGVMIVRRETEDVRRREA